MTARKNDAPESYGPEPLPSPGWHVVPDIGSHDFLRKEFEAGNGYALVVATMDRTGYVLPAWIAEAWRALAAQCMSGKLTWNEALAPRAQDGHKVKLREHQAELQAESAIGKYRHHRFTIDLRRRRGEPVDDPLEGLAKDSDQFAAAVARVMGVSRKKALYLYNSKLPKAERYPYKSRKSAIRKRGR